MRLLQTSNFELVSRRDDNIPPYAILSHTWGEDDEEVSLQDLQYVLSSRRNASHSLDAQSIMVRPGFIKIQGAAKLALEEGYEFIWIDTCCIDKTSSAELSEAINSMFRWYEQSAVCYVYLSDVEDPTAMHLQPEAFQAEISNSRWFTRGWTLQELIAPPTLRFYSKSWVFLASKRGHFGSYLSEITGIEIDALNGLRELEYFSIATRMKWASQRMTTRPEDMAYCLMGIFSVNMPLLYGEGTKAFIRLQEEILKGNDDQSIFAWRCPTEDPLSGRLSGLLAKTPAWFQHSGHFRPLPINADAFASAPSSMTNAGLYVQFRLHSPKTSASNTENGEANMSDQLAAVLHCSPYKSEDQQDNNIYKAALRLQHLGGDRYSRVNSDSIIDIQPSELDAESRHPTYKYIYVKQNPIIKIPDIYVDDRMLNHDLLSVWVGKGEWDGSTNTLRCNTPGRNGVLGVFRYSLQRPGIKGYLIDVMVGFHSKSQKLGPSSYWCFQQTAHDNEIMESCSPPIGIDLVASHEHQNVLASVKLNRKDKIYNELTLELKQVKPLVFPIDENSFYVVPLTPMALMPSRKQHYISSCFSILTQPDLLTTEKFQTDFIRAESAPDSRILKHPTVLKLRANFRTVQGPKIYCQMPRISYRMDERQKEAIEEEHSHKRARLRALIRACLDGDYATVKLRISADGKAYVESLLKIPTSHKPEQWTNSFRLIHWAVAGGDQRIVCALLDCDYRARTRFHLVDPSDLAPDKMGLHLVKGWLTTLHIAAIMGNVPVLRDLIEGSEKDWAAILKPMPSSCESFDHPYDSPMHLLASYLHSPEVGDAFLCFKGIVQRNKPGAVSNWVNADRNGLGETPLHRAAAMNNTHAVSAILANLPNVRDLECLDNKERSPLWHAAAADAYDALLLLLSRGADANTRDELGIPVLHAACRSARSEIVQALLSHGADPNACAIIESRSKPLSGEPQFTCMTPCMYAALRGSATTLCALLSAGSRIDGPYQSDLTPLHVAVANGHLDFVKVLCEVQGNDDARTPYLLRKQNELPGVELLVFAEGQEWTVIEIAKLSDEIEIFKYLESL